MDDLDRDQVPGSSRQFGRRQLLGSAAKLTASGAMLAAGVGAQEGLAEATASAETLGGVTAGSVIRPPSAPKTHSFISRPDIVAPGVAIEQTPAFNPAT